MLPKEPSMDQQEKAREMYIENCHLLRDLIFHDKHTKSLWKILMEILTTRKAYVLANMQRAKKRIPVNEGFADADFTESDFYKCIGELAGLDFLSEEVTIMVRKAEADDAEQEEN